jgi:hypothetical protein
VELWRSKLTSVGGGGRRARVAKSEQVHDKRAEDEQPQPLRPLSNNSKNRIVTRLHGVFARASKAYGLPVNPVAGIERQPVRLAGDIYVLSTEVWALVRAAASEQDGAIFLTAAFTGCVAVS